MTHWSEKYLETPFKERGRDLVEGVDCWGLVYNVLRDEFKIHVPSYDTSYETTKDVKAIAREIRAQLPEWRQIVVGKGETLQGQTPKPGDLALFSIAGEPVHIGIVVSEHEMLHIRDKVGVSVESFLAPIWCRRLLGVYRHAPGTTEAVEIVPTRHFGVVEGVTIGALVGDLAQEFRDQLIVTIDGEVIEDWFDVVPAAGERLEVRLIPAGGGGGILEAVAIIAVSVFAPQVALAFGFTAGTIGFAIASSVISTVGLLAVNSLFGTTQPVIGPRSRRQDPKESPNYFIQGARNRAEPFGVIPKVLGKVRMVPPLAAQSYVSTEGDDQYLHMLLCWGYGDISIEDLKIGDTPINVFDADAQFSHHINKVSGVPSLYPKDVHVDNLNNGIQVKHGSNYIRRTPRNTTSFVVDIVFGGGLVQYNDEGNRQDRTVALDVAWRPAGTERFVTIRSNVTASTSQPHRWTRTIGPSGSPTGEYDVRVTRVTENSDDAKVRDEFTWTQLTSTQNNAAPVNQPQISDHARYQRLAMTAIKIRATEQLNSTIDQINAVITSKVADFSSGSWSKRKTNNPASLFMEVLYSQADEKHISSHRTTGDIDYPSIEAWWRHCDENNLAYNMVRDFRTSTWEVLSEIAAAGNAVPSLKNGKIGVIIDEERPLIKQLFTPRNSKGFVAEVAYPDLPDAVRVRFLNEAKDYLSDEVIINRIRGEDEGDVPRQRLIENMEFRGVTNLTQITNLTHAALLRAQIQNKKYSLETDAEILACDRGDRIRVSHSVLSRGASYGRIVSRNGNTITLDCKVEQPIPDSNGRTPEYSLVLRNVNTFGESVITIRDDNQIQLATPITGMGVGDLVCFGPTENYFRDYLVESIEFGEDLSATVNLVDYYPGFYSGNYAPPDDSGTPGGTNPGLDTTAPGWMNITSMVVSNSYYASDGSAVLDLSVDVQYQPNAPVAAVAFELQRRVGSTWSPSVIQPSTDANFIIPAIPGGSAVQVRVRAIAASSTADRGPWHTSSVSRFNSNVVAGAALPGIGSIFIRDSKEGLEHQFETKDFVVEWDFNEAGDSRFVEYGYRMQSQDKSRTVTGTTTRKELRFTYDDNEDLHGGDGTANRTLVFTVWAIGVNNITGPESTATLTNPQVPKVSLYIAEAGDAAYFRAELDNADLPDDFKGLEVHRSLEANFTPSNETLQKTFKQDAGVIDAVGGEINYFRVAAFDKFGTDNLQYSEAAQADFRTANTITGDHIKDRAIGSRHIGTGQIGHDHLGTAIVENDNIADNTITGTKFQNGSIGEAKLATNAVATAKIKDKAISTAKLDDTLQVAIASIGTSSDEPGPVIPTPSITLNSVAPGTIMMWANSTPPDGWLFCDGQNLARHSYPELYAAVGPWYTESGLYTTFRESDLGHADTEQRWIDAAENYFKLPNLDPVPLPQGQGDTPPTTTSTSVAHPSTGNLVSGTVRMGRTDGSFSGADSGMTFLNGAGNDGTQGRILIYFGPNPTVVKLYAVTSDNQPAIPFDHDDGNYVRFGRYGALETFLEQSVVWERAHTWNRSGQNYNQEYNVPSYAWGSNVVNIEFDDYTGPLPWGPSLVGGGTISFKRGSSTLATNPQQSWGGIGRPRDIQLVTSSPLQQGDKLVIWPGSNWNFTTKVFGNKYVKRNDGYLGQFATNSTDWYVLEYAAKAPNSTDHSAFNLRLDFRGNENNPDLRFTQASGALTSASFMQETTTTTPGQQGSAYQLPSNTYAWGVNATNTQSIPTRMKIRYIIKT